MKWMKKWSYILLFIGTGAVYLSCIDNWQVYAKQFAQIKNWYADMEPGNLFGPGENEGQASGGGSSNGAGMEVPPPEEDPMNVFGEGTDESSRESVEGEGEAAGTEESGPSVVGEDGNRPPGEEESRTGSSNEVTSGEGAGELTPSEGEMSEEAGGEDGTVSSDPVYMTVEDDYFADAVFIGDSRTVGMFEYGGLEETAAFYASTGLTVYKMFDSAIVPVPGQKKKITVEEALQQNTFAKIYLMIGINEMGTGTVESFLEAYQGAVAHLRELQPDAVIYLQGIMRVTSERSAQGDYINNEGIDARNEGIARMADNEKIFYLDVNPLICDETGGMIPDYTFDGVHLKAKYIEIWKDYLKSHAISS